MMTSRAPLIALAVRRAAAGSGTTMRIRGSRSPGRLAEPDDSSRLFPGQPAVAHYRPRHSPPRRPLTTTHLTRARTLASGGDGYCLHSTLQASPQARDLPPLLRRIGDRIVPAERRADEVAASA